IRTDLGSEYVLLYRNNQFDLEKQHPSFKNRVDLKEGQIKTGDVSLVLKNVSTDDRGTYECLVIQRVTNHNRETVLYINLDVVPPPGELFSCLVVDVRVKHPEGPGSTVMAKSIANVSNVNIYKVYCFSFYNGNLHILQNEVMLDIVIFRCLLSQGKKATIGEFT
uniref:Immunoglobulin V-set domain-containing protein n=1 Tax=Fundulus heteroclitus TaxID=8078 RepID=A0A3Q2R1L0_FUNHE